MLLVHAALILGWQTARTPPPVQAEGEGAVLQWIRLPAPPSGVAPSAAPQEARRPARPAPVRSARPGAAAVPAAPDPEPAAAPASDAGAPPRPFAESIMESARRSAGSIDRALRRENRPTIILPPDSPQIRLRQGMEQAHEMAPPRLWEAPKVQELVNNTGDGARRTRVTTGNGTYCITEVSPVTSIDMIEKHGKQRLTSCPRHEEPARKQEWRTARD
ncbi:hypothetical protein [Massilia niastensis]|uniref:hypothetical protein n=1 Tax=Massilia niastensis TaxID=544911 RepID=UPI0003A60121|nr:hypothetical protein [Massilia niastensis]